MNRYYVYSLLHKPSGRVYIGSCSEKVALHPALLLNGRRHYLRERGAFLEMDPAYNLPTDWEVSLLYAAFTKEEVLRVEGQYIRRSPKTFNIRIPTGKGRKQQYGYQTAEA